MNELEACRIAFETRRGDAVERAEHLKKRMEAEIASYSEIAEANLNAAEACVEAHKINRRKCGDYNDRRVNPPESLKEMEGAFRQKCEAAASAAVARAEIISEVEELLRKQRHQTMDSGGPTTESLIQSAANQKGDPVLRLVAKRHLTNDDLRAAREIAAIYFHLTANLFPRTSRYAYKPDEEDKDGSKYTAAEMHEWYSLMHVQVYLPWADRVRKDLPMVIDLVVEGRSIDALRREYRMSWDRALGKVRDALQEYRRLRRRHEDGRFNERQRPEDA